MGKEGAVALFLQAVQPAACRYSENSPRVRLGKILITYFVIHLYLLRPGSHIRGTFEVAVDCRTAVDLIKGDEV